VIIIIPLHVPYTNYNTSTSINKLISIQVICLSKLGVPRILCCICGFRADQRPKQNGFRAGQRHNVNMFNKSKQTFPKNYVPQTQLGYNNSEVPFGSSVVAPKRCTGHHLELLAISPTWMFVLVC
jgi:hypothetical protein